MLKKNRFLSLLLTMALVISSFAIAAPSVASAAVEGDVIRVIAGSDFQNQRDNPEGVKQVNKFFDQIMDYGIDSIDGFLFCGDYDYDLTNGVSQTKAGVDAMYGAVESAFGTGFHSVMIKGNHDSANGTAGMALSGNNDSDDFGVFVINEDDFMWHNSNENRIKQTGENLKKYLDGKRRAKYTKPIFVLSHLPLHYSMRSYNEGDNVYSHYIFDELNEAGEAGLNIIFLFGHNHSNAWDDYIGGASICLKPGDNINISAFDKKKIDEETLNFAYINAGYTGYYAAQNAGDDATLTMTSYEITDEKVVINRFDENGIHVLKAKGVTNKYKNEDTLMGYAPDETVYESGYEFMLNKEITAPEGDADDSDCDHPRSQIIDAKEASCKEAGYSGDKVCTNCGSVLEKGTEVAKKDHSFNDGVTTKHPSETAEGEKTQTCTVCGEKKITAIPKLAPSTSNATPAPQTADQVKAKVTVSGKKTVKVGKSIKLKAKLTGVKGKVKWSVNKKKLATISSAGKLKAKKKGTVVVTAKVGTVKGTLKVKIK